MLHGSIKKGKNHAYAYYSYASYAEMGKSRGNRRRKQGAKDANKQTMRKNESDSGGQGLIGGRGG